MTRALVLLLALVGCAPLMGAKAKDDVVKMTTAQLKAAMEKSYNKGKDDAYSKHDAWCRPNI